MKFKMKKLLLLVAVVATVLSLSACFGGQKPMRYYTMVLPEGKPMVSQPFPARLFVKKATIDPAYRRNNIVYRESAYDFMFYNYSAWATRPEYIVEQAVSFRIEQAGLFQTVDNALTAKPDYELALHISALEEVDSDDGRKAHLAMTFTFRNTDVGGELWNKRYDSQKSYEGEDMREFATAVSKLLETFTDDALKEIKNVMESQPAKQTSVELPAAAEMSAPEESSEE